MHTTFFRAGEIVLRVETDEELNLAEPYGLFVCEEAESDAQMKFFYTEKIGDAFGKLIRKTDNFDVYEDGGYFYFYYHIVNDTDCYALRRVKKGGCFHEIFIPEEYRGKIWTRLVFNLINFDDLASEHSAAVFHSSVIEYDGGAILFTAPCGTGKSTQADLWHEHRNAEIINGDKIMIYEKDGGYFAAGVPFSGSSAICKNKILPVRAIVRLGQAKENILRRLSGIGAYKAIFEGCYHSKWNGEYNENTALLTEKFAKNVPVYSLECLPDVSAVETLENGMENCDF